MSVDSLASAPPFQYKFLISSDISEQLRRQNGASRNIRALECLQWNYFNTMETWRFPDTESQVLVSLLSGALSHDMSYLMKIDVAN